VQVASRGTNRQIRSLVLGVGLVRSRRIWPAHVGCLVDLVCSRRVPSDRLDDQARQATPRAGWVEHKIRHLVLYLHASRPGSCRCQATETARRCRCRCLGVGDGRHQLLPVWGSNSASDGGVQGLWWRTPRAVIAGSAGAVSATRRRVASWASPVQAGAHVEGVATG
jgi:hypothetical protein